MKKLLVLIGVIVVVALFSISTTFAAGENPPQSDAVTESGAAETASGNCAGCNGWVWSHVEEAWRYVVGSEERLWVNFRVEVPPVDAVVDTGDVRHLMFLEAASSGNWLGCYWSSSSVFTNVRLWYN